MNKDYFKTVILSKRYSIPMKMIEKYDNEYPEDNLGLYYCYLKEVIKWDSKSIEKFSYIKPSIFNRIINKRYMERYLQHFEKYIHRISLDAFSNFVKIIFEMHSYNCNLSDDDIIKLLDVLDEKDIIDDFDITLIHDLTAYNYGSTSSSYKLYFREVVGNEKPYKVLLKSFSLEDIDKIISLYETLVYSGWEFVNFYLHKFKLCKKDLLTSCNNINDESDYLNRITSFIESDYKGGPNNFYKMHYPNDVYKTDANQVKEMYPDIYDALMKKIKKQTSIRYMNTVEFFKSKYQLLKNTYGNELEKVSLYDFINTTEIKDIIHTKTLVYNLVKTSKELRPFYTILTIMAKKCIIVGIRPLMKEDYYFKSEKIGNDYKLKVINYMKDNEYPLYSALYYEIIRRSINGEIIIE